jgi:hypothetical protein
VDQSRQCTVVSSNGTAKAVVASESSRATMVNVLKKMGIRRELSANTMRCDKNGEGVCEIIQGDEITAPQDERMH